MGNRVFCNCKKRYASQGFQMKRKSKQFVEICHTVTFLVKDNWKEAHNQKNYNRYFAGAFKESTHNEQYGNQPFKHFYMFMFNVSLKYLGNVFVETLFASDNCWSHL